MKSINIKRLTKFYTSNPTTNPGRQIGAALITSLLVLSLLTTLSITVLRMSSLQEKMTRNQKLLTTAGFAAERGISEAIRDLLDETINDSGPGESTTSTTWAENVTPSTDWSPAFLASSKGYDFNYGVSHRLVGGVVATNDDNKPYYLISSIGTSDKAGIGLNVVVSLSYSSYFETGLVGCYGVKFLSNSVSDSFSSSGAPSTGQQGGIATLNVLDADHDGMADAPNFDGSILIDAGADIAGPARATGSMTLNSGASVHADAYANGEISLGSNAWVGDDAWSNDNIGGYGAVNGTSHPNQANQIVDFDECDPIGLTGPQGVFATGEHQDAQNDTVRYLPITGRNDNPALLGSAPTGYTGSYDYSFTSKPAAADILGVAGASKKYYFTDFNVDVPTGSSPLQIEVRGDVTLFIDGDFSLKNAAKVALTANSSLVIYLTGIFLMESNTELNNGGITAKLQIYSTAENSTDALTGPGSENPKVEILSNAGFSGAVYAPYANVVTQSYSDISGAIRGKWVVMEQNAGFHYDEDLQNLGEGSPNGYQQVYWSQQSFIASGVP